MTSHKQTYRELKALCGGNEHYYKHRLRDLMEVEFDIPDRTEKIAALRELIQDEKNKPKAPKYNVNDVE